VRYEERGQGYHDIEKVGKHWYKVTVMEDKLVNGQNVTNILRLYTQLLLQRIACASLITDLRRKIR
jgi:hypothetical protein